MSDRRLKGAAEELQRLWQTDPRWTNVDRDYTAEDVIRLRGSVQEEHTLARLGAERLWDLLHEGDYINALGALTGNQAVQQVRAGRGAVGRAGGRVAAGAGRGGRAGPGRGRGPAGAGPAGGRGSGGARRR